MSNPDLLPKRIIKETQRLLTEPAPGIVATPYKDNLRYFNVVMQGPSESPYTGVCDHLQWLSAAPTLTNAIDRDATGGIFKLELFLPEEYPMAPPKACSAVRARSSSPLTVVSFSCDAGPLLDEDVPSKY